MDTRLGTINRELEVPGEGTVRKLLEKLFSDTRGWIVIANGRIMNMEAKLEGIDELYVVRAVYGG